MVTYQCCDTRDGLPHCSYVSRAQQMWYDKAAKPVPACT